MSDYSPNSPSHLPDPALKRLDRLVGTWKLTGRTLGATEDNISGMVIIEWLPGGYFMQQRGEITIGDFTGHSLEILSYDSATDTFPSTVYSDVDGAPMRYEWDVQGDIVTHWTEGSKYTGRFNGNSTILDGGWRPDEGIESNDGNTYDATMIRVK